MNDEYYMSMAIKEAGLAIKKNEVPIGCVIVKDDKVIAKSHNRKEIDKIATHHAEILAINIACKRLKTWHLEDCVLYTTVEPCLMCTGAIIQSRIKKVVYGTDNPAFGYLSKLNNSKIEVIKDILKENSQELLSLFFKGVREK